MRLRLYHHGDGARVAYRESGTGPALVLLHSLGLSYREWEPVVEPLSARFRVVLPDLPLHGDSEDRPRHPYTPAWLTDVVASFCNEVAGPRPMLGGHDLGAELAVRAVIEGAIEPARLVVMNTRLHRRDERPVYRAAWRYTSELAAVPGLDRLLSHAAGVVFRPSVGMSLTSQRNPAARDLLRHAFADVGGNANRARSWARFVRHWPQAPQRELLDAYGSIRVPVLLLWAEDDRLHPLEGAQQALDLLPDAQLRTLPGTGFLIAYDDPVGLARELIAFCG
jgi:pimeloyl-ACP methyl ester carboxylesterase